MMYSHVELTKMLFSQGKKDYDAPFLIKLWHHAVYCMPFIFETDTSKENVIDRNSNVL
jgi:lysophospholipid acyltransferase (LPLAT)-like uncharacterized protein